MYKYVKTVVFVLLAVLSLQQVAFASGETKRPPKPTEGVESSNPNYGSSTDVQTISPERISGLLTDWKCSITNNGADLYLDGASTATDIIDQLTLTLYLQRWDGSQWVDANNWVFNKYDAKSLYDGTYVNFTHGNYYRARSVHFAKNGSQTDTQYSTSSYIYVP